ncbi:MAG: glutamine-hydrolyzing GMP synthase [Candidatus Lokiarchaeota archaeon]|nr:glutamine-hydrolyzing GMP synthase [Candidatus Lokiarchaeota archaeon]
MDKIFIMDMGSQYSHLIARRVRELGIYSEIIPYNISISDLMFLNPKGIILSGGPSSVYEENSPKLEKSFYEYVKTQGIPVLGICYGLHLIIHQLGGKIDPNNKKEYGKTELDILEFDSLFYSLNKEEIVWMSHGDQISEIPAGFKTLARTKNCPIAAFGNEEFNIYGVQFHPEVVHTARGTIMLKNFIYNIVGAKKEWKLNSWIETNIESIKKEIGPNNRVILGLSGGVDSSVCAVLLHNAIGDRLHCIFVNNGLLRKNEDLEVQKQFKEKLNFKNFHYIDAERLFLERLKGVDDPEEKRKIIGHTFIEVFENKTLELETEHPSIKYLAQGTIYPDRVETATTSKNAAKIKSHHNLTLPENMKLKIIEPLKDLYKDEVRKIGKQLGIEAELIDRHPFPGPGLAVRCVGAIDKEKLNILREADLILLEEIRKAGIYNDLWQVFCVLLPVKTVGVMGDFRTYEYICAIRAVESKDVMTASFAKLDWDLLEKIGTRIINEVKGFNRVVYDISNKPPSTIEYE